MAKWAVTMRNENGFVLATSLWILLLLVFIGMAAMTTSTTEQLIGGNDKFHNVAFYHADAGISASAKVISAAIQAGAAPPASLFDPDPDVVCAVSGTPDFYSEIMGFTPDADTNPLTNPEFTFTLDDTTVRVNIQRTGQEILAGGGAEFASGSSGVGAGSAGGVAVLYEINSVGQAPNGAVSDVVATYRKLPGVAGGL